MNIPSYVRNVLKQPVFKEPILWLPAFMAHRHDSAGAALDSLAVPFYVKTALLSQAFKSPGDIVVLPISVPGPGTPVFERLGAFNPDTDDAWAAILAMRDGVSYATFYGEASRGSDDRRDVEGVVEQLNKLSPGRLPWLLIDVPAGRRQGRRL